MHINWPPDIKHMHPKALEPSVLLSVFFWFLNCGHVKFGNVFQKRCNFWINFDFLLHECRKFVDAIKIGC